MMSAAGVDVKTLAEAQAEMARLQGELADLQRAAVELQQARAPPPVAVVQESTAEFQRILESSGVSPQLIKEFRVPLEAWQRTLETVVPTLELPGAPSLPGASSLASFDMPSLPPLDGLWESPILASFSLPTLPSGVSVPTLPSLELSVPAPVPLPVLPEMPTSVAADLASASDLASAGLAALHTPLVAELTPAGAALQLGAIALFAVGSGIGRADSKNGEAPYAAGTTTYSPTTADAFYRARPLLVANRMLKLAYLTSAFTSGVLFDWLVLGKLLKDEEYTALKKAEPRRAKEALVLCEQLGPTFIKLGQALSIRTDLIPEAYALELRQLQDAVPPFASDEAYEVLRMQLGVRDLSQVFESLSPAPIASASIGQVYRGTLKDENQTAVAVKVQRPGILADIALDVEKHATVGAQVHPCAFRLAGAAEPVRVVRKAAPPLGNQVELPGPVTHGHQLGAAATSVAGMVEVAIAPPMVGLLPRFREQQRAHVPTVVHHTCRSRSHGFEDNTRHAIHHNRGVRNGFYACSQHHISTSAVAAAATAIVAAPG